MSDRDVVKQLQSLAPSGKFHFEEDSCVSVDLTDATNPLVGVVRFSEDKKRIHRLLSKLEKIKQLNLQKNCFNEPIEINATNLIKLNLSSNYMKRTPSCIKYAFKIEDLELGVNELNEFPDWAAHKSLRILRLHKNKLAELPDISNCVGISILNVYFNNFKRIPSCIWNLKNITFFSWGVSGVSEIPEEIFRWKELRYLSFVSSKIERLPDCICNLKNIIGLRLQKNKLKSLPDNIGNLSNLEHLTIFDNFVCNLPSSFFDLRLKKLNLGMNPLNSDLMQSAAKVSSDFFFGRKIGK
jgi:Leucine-rich repeat (LRR) protein